MRRNGLIIALLSLTGLGATVSVPRTEQLRSSSTVRRDKISIRASRPNGDVEVVRMSKAPAEAEFSAFPTVAPSESIAAQNGPALAAPTNDSCASPETITGSLPVSTPFDTLDTVQAGDGPVHNALVPGGCVDPGFVSDGGGMDHDLWFCWNSTYEGPVQVDTCTSGGTDTRLAVYAGCACPANDSNLLTCNDDGCVMSLQSQVTFDATLGQDYMIRVGRFPGDSGVTGTDGTLTIDSLAPPCDLPAPNCQEPGQDAATDAIRSDTSGTTFDRLLADDFTPAVNGDVTEVCWWGMYVGPGPNPGTIANCPNPMVDPNFSDKFSIRYYGDAGGIPGDLIAGPFQPPRCSNFPSQSCDTDDDCKACSLVPTVPCATSADCQPFSGECIAGGTCTDPALRLTLNVPTPTGFILPLVAPFQEYEYSAVHAPVHVAAGECYWIEISNASGAACPWFWEASPSGNGRAFEDDDVLTTPTYQPLEFVPGFDAAYCLNVDTGNPQTACNPPGPANDDCATGSAPISDGVAAFDSSGASTDGPVESGCGFLVNNRIDNDIWFDYVATCSETLFVDLCGSSFDTRVAIYEGDACPTAPDGATACDDDSCGPSPRFQSHVSLAGVTLGQHYQIRVGGFNFESGPGELHIGCGANVCEVAQRNCCDAGADPGPGPGCGDQTCCNLICSLDPFCCNNYWDSNCATLNTFTSVCDGSLEDCTGDPSVCPPGENCITADATNFCQGICSPCIDGPGPYDFLDPPNDITDARQPHPIDNDAALQGFQVFTATAPPGVEDSCWQVCSTDAGDPNHGAAPDIVENPPGTYTITLSSRLKAGATTTILYTSTTGNTIVTGTYTMLPGDVDASGASNGADLGAIIACLSGGTCFDWECDIDRSGTCSGADLEWAVNLLNGAGQFDSWDGKTPASERTCP